MSSRILYFCGLHAKIYSNKNFLFPTWWVIRIVTEKVNIPSSEAPPCLFPPKVLLISKYAKTWWKSMSICWDGYKNEDWAGHTEKHIRLDWFKIEKQFYHPRLAVPCSRSGQKLGIPFHNHGKKWTLLQISKTFIKYIKGSWVFAWLILINPTVALLGNEKLVSVSEI